MSPFSPSPFYSQHTRNEPRLHLHVERYSSFARKHGPNLQFYDCEHREVNIKKKNDCQIFVQETFSDEAKLHPWALEFEQILINQNPWKTKDKMETTITIGT